MGPPGQPWSRWSGFCGFPPFLALVQAVTVAVHLQDMDMVGETVQQGPGEAFGAEDFGPFGFCIDFGVSLQESSCRCALVAAVVALADVRTDARASC